MKPVFTIESLQKLTLNGFYNVVQVHAAKAKIKTPTTTTTAATTTQKEMKNNRKTKNKKKNMK